MVFQKIIDTIFGDLSGIKAREHVSHLTHYHRIQASPDFRKAAEYVHAQLEEAGFLNAHIMEFPANGQINQWDWESPIAWRANDAELWMLEPQRELLCDFKEIPISLLTHSQSASCVADLIDVGTGTEESCYQKDNIRGSIILATGAARDIYPLMIRHEVRGLLHYPSDMRAFNHPDLIAGDAFGPVDEDRGRVPFGFCISKRQAERLRSMLAEGKKVRLQAFVDAQLYDGNLDLVEASIPCEDDSNEAEEVLLVAHLCNPKPSANDNASGSGLLLEIARVLKKLIAEGKLAENRRTIRFLWLPEYSGAIAWLHWNYPRLNNIAACIILNAVGESPEKIGTPLRVSIPPYSTESYLEDLFESIAEIVAQNENYRTLEGSRRKLRYELETFSGTSDHSIFIDKYFNIPSVMLGHDEPFMNTNYDVMDNVDPTEMLRTGIIAATAAYGLATPHITMARQILLFQKAGSLNRINQFLKHAFINVYNAQNTDIEMKFYNEVGKATFLIKREEMNLESLYRYYHSDEFRDKAMEIKRSIKVYAFKELKSMEQALRERATELGYQIASLNVLPKDYMEAQILIPEKIANAPFKGLFKKIVFQRLDKTTKDWLRNNSLRRKSNVYGEIHNFINGENSIYDIFMAIDLQFGNIKLGDLRTYLMLMQRWKLITVKMIQAEGDSEEMETQLLPQAGDDMAAVLPPLAEDAGLTAEESTSIDGIEGLESINASELEAREALLLGLPIQGGLEALETVEDEAFKALEALENEAMESLETGILDAEIQASRSMTARSNGAFHARTDGKPAEPAALPSFQENAEEPEISGASEPQPAAAAKADMDELELDLEGLELDLKKIVVRESSKPQREVKKVVVEDIDDFELDFDGIDAMQKGSEKNNAVMEPDELDPDNLIIDFDKIKGDI